MSDLVGNPEDRFSQNEAQMGHVMKNLLLAYEPRSEKTGLRGFQPGPTQTGLYSHKRWLEA